MNTRLVKASLIFVICDIGARSIFTPLSIQWQNESWLMKNKAYDPYAPIANEKDDRRFVIDLWGIGYSRSAECAYACNGACQVPMACLIFGASSFTLSQAFAHSQVSLTTNPWVSLSTIQPSIDAEEQGAIVRACWRTQASKHRQIRWGVRAQLPIKSLKMHRRILVTDAANESTSSQSNLCQRMVTENIETPDGTKPIYNSFAYRLDFLSRLVTNNSTNQPIVNYDTIPLLMGSDNVTESNANGSVNVIKRASTLPPAVPYSIYKDYLPATYIAGDGSGLSDNERGQFYHTTSYASLATNQNAQSQLWVVPTVVNKAGLYDVSDAAAQVRSLVERQLQTLDQSSIIDYMASKGLNLNTQKVMGLGDADIQVFVDYDWLDYWLTGEFSLGVALPTGVSISNVYVSLAQPLGNNGHAEVYPGFELMWDACKWFCMNADIAYHWVLPCYERVAAAFDGATIKNIGPCTLARIYWRYFLFHVNVQLFEPTHRQAGVNIGYELYKKTHDHICFKCSTVTDFEGNDHTLNAGLLTYLTRAISHKIQTEFFINTNNYSLFGGFDWVFAGKNVPKEVCYHFGFLVEF